MPKSQIVARRENASLLQYLQIQAQIIQKKSDSRKTKSPGKVAKITTGSRRVMTGYEGKFPECLKKDTIPMSEDEKHIVSHFVEINDHTGVAKFKLSSYCSKV